MNLYNLDLISVGVAIASIAILGFAVFFNNRRSVTNRTFLTFSLIAVFWNGLNYIFYQVREPAVDFWIIRLVIFFAVWYCFFLFRLFYVFPKEKFEFNRWYKFLVPIVILTSGITLTPLVFREIGKLSPDNRIIKIINGPGIFFFGLVVVILVLSGIIILLRKLIRSSNETERKQYIFVILGGLITFSLYLIFNFFLPSFYDNANFIPLSAVFTFPLIAFTAYAIFKHHLLGIKVIATEILTFVLAVVSLLEVSLSTTLLEIIFRSLIFSLVLIFGIFLIQSVRREVEQREKLEQLTKELEAANEKLQEIDRMKSQFYSFVSHQIKTPIGIIKGFTSLLLDGSYGVLTDNAKETIAKMRDAADRLIGLVENFLDLRKIESGKMDYSFEDVDVVNLVRKMVEELKPLAVRKNLELSFHSPVAKVMIKADVQRLTNVFQNLIDNAIKYTETGWVRVEMKEESRKGKEEVENHPQESAVANRRESANEVVITVSDSGLGIAKDVLPTLFEQYTRDAKVTKTIAGTGLGLYLAKEIIQGHKGEVWVESEGEGKGSRFIVKLPVVMGSHQ